MDRSAFPLVPFDPARPSPGTIIDGKYRIEETLGKGGMGIVVRATHLRLREEVALKFLHGEIAKNPTHVERFLREARAAIRIRSEHVATVFDVGLLPTGEPFMVMELLSGKDLHRVITERRQLPVAEAVDYVQQACTAIALAHQQDIVHRDLKPANLFLTSRANGTPLVKVLDFGIAKLLDGVDERITNTTDVLGSPAYMSPEHIRDSRTVDGRTDIWALGTILYKLLTGRAPFVADTTAGTLARIITDPVEPLRAQRPDVSPALEAVVMRCLEKVPERRFQRVDDLSAALASSLLENPGELAPIVVRPGPAPAGGETTESGAVAASVRGTGPIASASRVAVIPVALAVLVATGLVVALSASLLARTPPAAASSLTPTPTAPIAATATIQAPPEMLSTPPVPLSSAASPVEPPPAASSSRSRGTSRHPLPVPPSTRVTPAPTASTLPTYGQD